MSTAPARDTLLRFLDTRPAPGFVDQLSTVAELRKFHPGARDGDLPLAIDVRNGLVRALLGPRDGAAQELSKLCETLDVRPSFSVPGERGWRVSGGGAIVQLLEVLITAAIAMWEAGERSRLHVCASASCIVPFVDESPRQNRRYCSQRCATRERVQKHRGSRSSASSDSSRG